MYCKIVGMLEIGKINPDSKIVGSINPNMEPSMAVCCESAMVEINSPSMSELNTKSMISEKRRI